MKYVGNVLYVGLAILVIVVAAATYYSGKLDAPPAPVPPIEAPAEPQVDLGPRHPMPEPLADNEGPRSLVPLPALDDSDAFFLLDIDSTFGSAIEALLVREAVIDRLVTTVDNLSRGKLAENIRPVGRLDETFTTDAGDDGNIVLGISSYARYDALIAQLYYADLDSVYDTYQRFYPLFQKSYERLGYPNAYFNDRLVEVIDHLIAAPTPDGPIVLARPNVLYEFADPDLEALSSGQKLMLRMGPNNSGTTKRILEKFRDQLTND